VELLLLFWAAVVLGEAERILDKGRERGRERERQVGVGRGVRHEKRRGNRGKEGGST
jgi:hypothetical protein